MISRPLSADPITRKTTTFHYDDNGIVTIETKQDVTDIIEHNKSAMAETDERQRYKEMARVAQIPAALWFQLKRDGIADNPERLRAWLNDRDNWMFRTRAGRV